ncbi:hypothetical protein EXE06_18365 [Acinetobacter pittii]|uniref:hypothetical protein n=1 Tax=Acinetobacter pittii TaxID=48296 RepID=UPI001022A661|nr:hypothetical protein [Acinetobacter pittii]RZG79467.1 hypothetical protein EXE06_18365 [Acinetobacter pittii]RZH52898.1 hypothetical protein EXD88_15010 [Acinetobacter pittii]RZH57474.1 hypothetical protein EXD90_13270 [Acinetobacter pittii]
MRRNAINDNLNEAIEEVRLISTYKKISKPKVQTIFGYLRSSLDYLAQDINSKLKAPKRSPNFPYGKDEEAFKDSINRYFPKLEEELPEIYKEVQNIQGFKLKDDWLYKLCCLNNKTKHDNAIEVKHEEDRKTINVYAGGVGLIQIVGNSSGRVMNNTVYGQRVDDFICDNGEVFVTKKGELPLDFQITNDKKILIGDELLDLIPFLNKCIENITVFIDKIYVLLDKL